MQLSNWNRTIVNEFGEVIPNAVVEVIDENTGDPADIYEDRAGTTPKDNPFTCGEDGFAEFYARGGDYRVEATGPTGTMVWRYEMILEPVGYKASQESFSTTEKEKLSTIQEGAQRNVDPVNNLNSTSIESPLSANQGRVVSEDLQEHKERADNPHGVTIEQLGFDSWDEVDVGEAILNAHRKDQMPHRFEDKRDNSKFYIGMEISEDGIPTLIYEEDE